MVAEQANFSSTDQNLKDFWMAQLKYSVNFCPLVNECDAV